jgi:preprotein translocase subunit SecA
MHPFLFRKHAATTLAGVLTREEEIGSLKEIELRDRRSGCSFKITRQRYFRLYTSLSGLTGTGSESRREFSHFFKLPVRPVDPHRPLRRINHPDRVYKNRDDQLRAVAAEVREKWERGQPVLVGTRTIRISEELSAILTEAQIPHRLLNASQDKEENAIVAAAGQPGSVVVATNMAGRGTHISLPRESLALGGLHVIGVERSESLRVDRQLAGRSARQGEPGSAVFFLSAEDHLVTQFAPSLARSLAATETEKDREGRLPEATAESYLRLQRRVQTIRYRQRLEMEKRDQWMDLTRKSLA